MISSISFCGKPPVTSTKLAAQKAARLLKTEIPAHNVNTAKILDKFAVEIPNEKLQCHKGREILTRNRNVLEAFEKWNAGSEAIMNGYSNAAESKETLFRKTIPDFIETFKKFIKIK